ncbi:MAG TPA: class I SAM-dependent methyltransferase [Mycobacterium sp.]
MDKIRIDLAGPPQTTLALLYAKALDADAVHPILGDQYAKAAVAQIDYDWTRTTIKARSAPSVTIRTAHFDNWVRQFLAVHPRSTVLHLGCGLDARAHRLNPGPDVDWYDVDYPEIIALRESIYPGRDHYTMVAASVTDPEWMSRVPADRPTLLIAEGLTMYLTEADGVALLRRVVERFPSGELQFDAFSRTGIRAQVVNTIVRRSGSTLHWGVDRPADIVDAVPGVRLLAIASWFDMPDIWTPSPGYRLMGRVMSAVPFLRDMATFHRYAF